MIIDYVVISSDDNPTYKDFYELVAKTWFKLGFKTYYINITTENSIEYNEYGVIHKIKSLDGIPTSFQSQVVRLFSSNLIEGNLLMSDIDMLPLNGDYFNENSKLLNKNNLVVFSSNPYQNVPYHAMCYILGSSKTFKEILNIENLSFKDYCKLLESKYGHDWNTDEKFFYDSSSNFKERLILLKRVFNETRIDRSSWSYDISQLQNKKYIDSHLLRPYNQNKKELDKLFSFIFS